MPRPLFLSVSPVCLSSTCGLKLRDLTEVFHNDYGLSLQSRPLSRLYLHAHVDVGRAMKDGEGDEEDVQKDIQERKYNRDVMEKRILEREAEIDPH